MKRESDAVVAAYRFHSKRRELFVEGQSDRDFIHYLNNYSVLKDVFVTEISNVKFDESVLGGEKGRLLFLARKFSGLTHDVRFLIDADSDKFFMRPVFGYVWLSDRRDLEGYLICEQSLKNFLCLACGCDSADIGSLIKEILAVGKKLGLLRNWAESAGYPLPFQKTDLSRYLTYSEASFNLQFGRYFQALLQNGQIGLSQKSMMLESFEGFEKMHGEVDAFQVVHGKDFVDMLQVFLRSKRVEKKIDSRDILVCFAKETAVKYETIQKVLAFLK